MRRMLICGEGLRGAYRVNGMTLAGASFFQDVLCGAADCGLDGRV